MESKVLFFVAHMFPRNLSCDRKLVEGSIAHWHLGLLLSSIEFHGIFFRTQKIGSYVESHNPANQRVVVDVICEKNVAHVTDMYGFLQFDYQIYGCFQK